MATNRSDTIVNASGDGRNLIPIQPASKAERGTPPTVIRAAAAIGIHVETLMMMPPERARKLAREAARLHEGRREWSMRMLDALEDFDEILDEAPITESVAGAFVRQGVTR